MLNIEMNIDARFTSGIALESDPDALHTDDVGYQSPDKLVFILAVNAGQVSPHLLTVPPRRIPVGVDERSGHVVAVTTKWVHFGRAEARGFLNGRWRYC